jgi:hypothetical protein
MKLSETHAAAPGPEVPYPVRAPYGSHMVTAGPRAAYRPQPPRARFQQRRSRIEQPRTARERNGDA